MTGREKLVAAALEEFSERGLHGARAEGVAARAAVNKSLLYRYFGDKNGLFEETLRQQIADRTEFAGALPDDLGEALVFWAARQASDKTFIRLVAEEGLRTEPGDTPRLPELRRAYYARQVADIARRQKDGQLPGGIAPEALFFALLLLTIGPVILPQIATLLMGPDAEDRWSAFLQRFAGALATEKSE